MNAVGFGNIINAYDPSIITVDGTMTLKSPKLILEPIKRYVSYYAINRMPNIEITALGGCCTLRGDLLSL